MKLNSDEKRVLLDLISKEQISMINKNTNKYKSNRYKMLEQLKVKIEMHQRG